MGPDESGEGAFVKSLWKLYWKNEGTSEEAALFVQHGVSRGSLKMYL